MLISEKTSKVLRYIKEKSKGEFYQVSLESAGAELGMPAYQVSRELTKLKTAGIIEQARTFRNQPAMYRYIGVEHVEDGVSAVPQPTMTLNSLLNNLPASVRTVIETFTGLEQRIAQLELENAELREKLGRKKR